MEPGRLLGGRYRLERELGRGGMSEVWWARDEVLGRAVAVKALAGPYATDTCWSHLIRAEAQAAARLSHPNVTSVYDYGESPDSGGEPIPYVVMELLPGRTLAERLESGPLPPRMALRVAAEIAAGLAAAHAQGLVHQDVKPANVVLTPSGAKVLDFGIAALAGRAERVDSADASDQNQDKVTCVDGTERATSSARGESGEVDLCGRGVPRGQLLGTPAYLAPERLTADTAEPASDVYALGLLLYRMLTGELPWPGVETTTEMLNAHVCLEPVPLPHFDGVPVEVSWLYRRCLSKDPADRPGAAQAAEVLARACGMQPRLDEEAAAAVTPPPVIGLPTVLVDAAPDGVGLDGAGPDGVGPDEVPQPPDEAVRPPLPVAAMRAVSAVTVRAPSARVRVAGGRNGRGNPPEERRRRRNAALVLASAILLAVVTMFTALSGAAAPDPDSVAGAARPPTGGQAQADPDGEPAGDTGPSGPVTDPTTAPGTAPATGAPTAPTPGATGTGPADAGANAGRNGGAGTNGGKGPVLPAGGTKTTDPPPPARTTPAGPPPPPPAGDRTEVSTRGGLIVALCVGRKVTVLSVLPALGYLVHRAETGPADEVRVEFRSVVSGKVEVRLVCQNGVPRARVKANEA